MSTRSCPTCDTALSDDAAFCSQCGLATATQILGEIGVDESAERSDRASASYEREPDRLRRALGPNYELGRLIGRGGYAEVFAVRDLKLKRELAVKVLRPDLILTPNLLARFRREALAVAALHHPHIVPVIDVGEAGGICFILMPLVQGESLKALLAREGPRSVQEATRILLEAASALATTHEAGVVHRDIKPENIMLEGRERRVRLMDFGIAKAMDSGDRELTGTGVVVGTPQYMSPEQATGDLSVDHRTDQYSLAVVGFQIVTGRVPFEGDTARAIITRQLLEPPPRLDMLVPSLPADFVATLHRAMEKDPARRFRSIDEFGAALRGEIAPGTGQPDLPRPASPAVSRRTRWVAAAAIIVGVSLAANAIRSLATPSVSAPLAPADTIVTAEPTPPPVSVRDPDPEVVAPAPAPPPPAPVATLPARVDTVRIEVPAPAVDSAPRTAAPAKIDCAAAFREASWAVALVTCEAEADSGSQSANRALATMYGRGLGTRADPEREVRYLERLGASGDATVLFDLATRYAAGDRGAPRDPTRATARYLGAAELGHQPAYAIVAERYNRGLGVPVNARKAAEWYEKAAKASDQPSRVVLAEMYAQGRGVPKNESLAFFWYETAAIDGHPEAQYQAALRYLRGRGVAASDSLGTMWLERAARSGHVAARTELDRRGR